MHMAFVEASSKQRSPRRSTSSSRKIVFEMENVDLTVLKPEDATLLRAVPVTSLLRGSLFNQKSLWFVPAGTNTYWCLVGAYVIVGILMQVGNVNWARWFRPGAGAQPKVHVE